MNNKNIRKQPGLTEKQYTLFENLQQYYDKLINHLGWNIIDKKIMDGGYISAVIYIKLSDNTKRIIKISAKEDLYSEKYWLKECYKNNIKVPKLILDDFSQKVIPFDYIIIEYHDAIRANVLNDDSKYNAGILFGKELYKMHQINSEGVGFTRNDNKFQKQNWKKLLINKITEAYNELKNNTDFFPEKNFIYMIKCINQKQFLDNITPKLIHSDPGGNNFLVTTNDEKKIKDYIIIDPNDWVGGEPMYDLAFSQIIWNFKPFMEGVYKGYLDNKQLSIIDKEKLVFYRMYTNYWASLSSYNMGWDIYKKLYDEFKKYQII